MTVKAKLLEAIHPGEILLEDFLKPLEISQNRLARELDVNVARVSDIVHGRASISAAMALRLGRFFGTSAEFWINLQSGYDLRLARRRDGERIEAKVRPLESAA
jgi:addiction module HigA family antidote